LFSSSWQRGSIKPNVLNLIENYINERFMF
jgi:hypothetical protein